MLNHNRSRLLSTTIVAGLAAGCFGLAYAPASAQEPALTAAQREAQERARQAAEAEETEVDEVVVTGSRIRRDSTFTSAQPIQVITNELIELKGVPDVATALQTSSLAAASFQLNDQLTGFVTQGGGGTQSLSLRGLGPQRTLVLVNGKRAGPAGTRGQVQAFDLGTIPQSQVERTDILKDGASSIYGSDAIAGVVNIITTQRLDGGSLSVYASQPFDTGGEQFVADAAWGRVFDRGYLNGSLEYYRQEELRNSDRDDTACAADLVTDEDTGAPLDYIDPRTGSPKCYNITANYIQTVSPARNLVPISLFGDAYNYNVPGNDSPYPGFARFGRGGYPDTFLYQPGGDARYGRSSAISPAERVSLSVTGGYDLTPNVEIYGDFLYHNRSSEQFGAGQVFQTFGARNTQFGAPNLLPASNPNNILGVNAVTVATYDSNNAQSLDYYRGVGGLRGSFDFAARNFSWDLYAQYTRSEATYDFGPRIYLDRFLAVNSPNVACTNNPLGGNVSNFDCSDLPNGVPWMSDRVLAGNFNQAERDFLFIEEEGTTSYDHAYIEGLVTTSDLFSLPAGDVGAALGFQVRREEIDDRPPEQAAAGNIALYSSAGRTTGSDTVREVFAEFDVPLLRDLPLINALDLNVSGRLSDYDSYGRSETYKVSANWQIIPSLRLRASTGTSFRAPALYELYLGAQTAFGAQTGVDPCVLYGTSGVDGEIQAACAALGIPDDYNAGGTSSALIITNGGLGVLEAETAKSTALGLIWTPAFADLSVVVDYFDIQIDDEVRQFGAYNIVEQCLRGNQEFCSLFDRDPADQQIREINNSYVNVASQNHRGIDLTFRYRRNLGFADLTLESQNSWKIEDKVNLLGGVVEDYLGTTFGYAGPTYAGNVGLTLSRGDLTWFYGVDMIGRGSDLSQAGVNAVDIFARYANIPAGLTSTDCTSPNNYCVGFKYFNEFTALHSTSVRYRLDDWTFQMGVNNLFDERPPSSSTGAFRRGTASLNGYDMRGRRGFVRVSRSF